MQKYDVFLSYKHTCANDEITSDSMLAEQIYYELVKRGFSVFYSEDSIFKIGISDYKKAIDTALDNTSILVVIASDIDFLRSGWVEYEYETFYEDILSERNKNGMIISYTDNVNQNQLPRTLSRFQNYSQSKTNVDKFIDFITNIIKSRNSNDDSNLPFIKSRIKPIRNQMFYNLENSHKSSYSSDYKNEFERLELQAKNCAYADEEALNYIFSQNMWAKEKELFVLDAGSAYGYVASDRFGPYTQVKKYYAWIIILVL